MPIVKRIALHGNISNTINYITQNHKTEDQSLVSSVNCGVATASEEMEMTRRKFHKNQKEKKNGGKNKKETEERVGYHIIQSFDLNDEITFREAHEIGERLVRELYPDYQAVIATHTDRLHLHNHIVINSVNKKTGQKLSDRLASKEGLYKLREASNKISKEYGCSITEEVPITTYKKRNYFYRTGSLKNFIREAVKTVTAIAKSVDDMISRLKKRGFQIRKKKGISIKSGSSGYVALDKLEHGSYTIENLNKFYRLGKPNENGEPLIEYIREESFDGKMKEAESIFDTVTKIKENYFVKEFNQIENSDSIESKESRQDEPEISNELFDIMSTLFDDERKSEVPVKDEVSKDKEYKENKKSRKEIREAIHEVLDENERFYVMVKENTPGVSDKEYGKSRKENNENNKNEEIQTDKRKQKIKVSLPNSDTQLLISRSRIKRFTSKKYEDYYILEFARDEIYPKKEINDIDSSLYKNSKESENDERPNLTRLIEEHTYNNQYLLKIQKQLHIYCSIEENEVVNNLRNHYQTLENDRHEHSQSAESQLNVGEKIIEEMTQEASRESAEISEIKKRYHEHQLALTKNIVYEKDIRNLNEAGKVKYDLAAEIERIDKRLTEIESEASRYQEIRNAVSEYIRDYRTLSRYGITEDRISDDEKIIYEREYSSYRLSEQKLEKLTGRKELKIEDVKEIQSNNNRIIREFNQLSARKKYCYNELEKLDEITYTLTKTNDEKKKGTISVRKPKGIRKTDGTYYTEIEGESQYTYDIPSEDVMYTDSERESLSTSAIIDKEKIYMKNLEDEQEETVGREVAEDISNETAASNIEIMLEEEKE